MAKVRLPDVYKRQTFVYVLVYLLIAAMSLALTRAWSLLTGEGVKPTAS